MLFRSYDGSGRVVRDKSNYGRCRFASGKEYDCDLSASYNIAARFFARRGRLRLLAQARGKGASGSGKAERRETVQQGSPAGGKTGWPTRGKRTDAHPRVPTVGPRTPVTLSSLWANQPALAAA